MPHLKDVTIPYVQVSKGNPTAFTCLGNWYDTADSKSMASLAMLLATITSKRDILTAIEEIREAMACHI